MIYFLFKLIHRVPSIIFWPFNICLSFQFFFTFHKITISYLQPISELKYKKNIPITFKKISIPHKKSHPSQINFFLYSILSFEIWKLYCHSIIYPNYQSFSFIFNFLQPNKNSILLKKSFGTCSNNHYVKIWNIRMIFQITSIVIVLCTGSVSPIYALF